MLQGQYDAFGGGSLGGAGAGGDKRASFDTGGYGGFQSNLGGGGGGYGQPQACPAVTCGWTIGALSNVPTLERETDASPVYLLKLGAF